MLWVSGTRVTVKAPPRGGLLLALESVRRKEVTSQGRRREERGPLPGHFCFLCICCPQCILGGNPEKVGSSWATEPNCSQARPHARLLPPARRSPAPSGQVKILGAGGRLFSSLDREHLEGNTMTCFALPLPGTQ